MDGWKVSVTYEGGAHLIIYMTFSIADRNLQLSGFAEVIESHGILLMPFQYHEVMENLTFGHIVLEKSLNFAFVCVRVSRLPNKLRCFEDDPILPSMLKWRE